MIFSSYPPKRDSLLYVARPLAVTLTCDAPSKALRPGISVLKDRTFRRFSLLVLPVVESFPGAQSPLGSKECFISLRSPAEDENQTYATAYSRFDMLSPLSNFPPSRGKAQRVNRVRSPIFEGGAD
jgi:hypothetical protein